MQNHSFLNLSDKALSFQFIFNLLSIINIALDFWVKFLNLMIMITQTSQTLIHRVTHQIQQKTNRMKIETLQALVHKTRQILTNKL